MRTEQRREMPSGESPERGRFDELAENVIDFASRGRFLVVVFLALAGWIGAGHLFEYDHRWLEAGAAGIAWLTLMLLFAVENANARRDQALQQKLNAIADALADFMSAKDVDDRHVHELREAVGLEQRESLD